jgi:dihydrofolate reductase
MLTTLFIATSLDGYIAGPDDDMSWLFTDADYGFDEFYTTVDTLIMGRGTYDVVRSMGRWPYHGKRTLVVTRNEKIEVTTPDTAYFNGSLGDLEKMLKEQGVKRSWLVGGGELVAGYLEQGLVEEVNVSVHPVLLGKGVPLFPAGFPKTQLELIDAEAFDSGLVQIRYRIKPRKAK